MVLQSSSRSKGTLMTIALLLGFFLVGCGSSSEDFVVGGSSAQAPTGAISVQQVLLRAIPAAVTQQRFTGFDAQGLARFGPLTRAKAATIELDGVSTAVTRLQIEYLQGDRVIGLGSVAVTVRAGETTLVVDPPFDDVTTALDSLQVTPAQATIASGTQQGYTALGIYADGTQLDLSSSVNWVSSNTAAATIDAGGLASGVAAGQTDITASLGAVSGTASLTVSAATVASIKVTPGAPAIADGTTQQFTATATLTDGSTQDVTATVTWASVTPATATVNATGLATSVAPGQTVVTASLSNVSGSATLTVTSSTITGLQVDPSAANSMPGSSRQYRALATLSDGSTQDVTSQVVWSSSSTNVTISNSALGDQQKGRAALALTTPVGQPVTITATFGSITGQAMLNPLSALYVTNLISDDISMYSMDPTTGALTSLGAPLPAGDLPQSIVLDPTGRYAYITQSGPGAIRICSVNPSTGALVSMETVAAPVESFRLGLDLAGTFGALLGQQAGVLPFTVDSDTGAIQLGTAVVPVGSNTNPFGLAVDPYGRFVFATNQSGAQQVVESFLVNPQSGALTSIGTVVSDSPYELYIEATGRHLYNTRFGGLDAYNVDQGSGALSLIEAYQTVDNQVNHLAFDPQDRFAYACLIRDLTQVPTIGLFSRNPSSGALVAGPVIASTGTFPRSTTVAPTGRFLFAANQASDNISTYTINQANGELTPVVTTPGGDSPQFIATIP